MRKVSQVLKKSACPVPIEWHAFSPKYMAFVMLASPDLTIHNIRVTI
jgi:hypothetical protein